MSPKDFADRLTRIVVPLVTSGQVTWKHAGLGLIGVGLAALRKQVGMPWTEIYGFIAFVEKDEGQVAS